MSRKHEISEAIKAEARRLGFSDCGISQSRNLEELKPLYNEWLQNNYQATMYYMERNVDKRLDPTQLVENSKSVISLLYNYYTPDHFKNSPYRISRYAYGKDYHDVIRDKLNLLLAYIEHIAGETISQRGFVDSAPVMERFWAQNSGLGWIGKNSCLVSRKWGSFVFISEIITSLELEYDEPISDYCGSCRKCIDACPTQAITEGRMVNSARCISYQTIENRGEIETSLKGKFENYIFGCDICQEVCPWNKKAETNTEPLFKLNKDLTLLNSEEWDTLTEEQYHKFFKGSAVKRTKYPGLLRNIAFSKK